MTPQQALMLNAIDASIVAIDASATAIAVAAAELRASLADQSPADTTPPTLAGSIAVSAITQTSYSLAWPAATDDVGVTGYDLSLDGGATWATFVGMLGLEVVDRTAGTTEEVRVCARDAAGNLSAVLSASVRLLDEVIDPPQASVHTRALNPAHILMVADWLAGGGAYDRDDKLRTWDPTVGSVQMPIRAWGVSGGDVPFQAAQYRVLVGGVLRATVDVAPGQRQAVVGIPLHDIPGGWQQIEIEPATPTSETAAPAFVYVQRGGPQPTMMPVLEGTHALRNTGHALVRWAWVPAQFAPTSAPFHVVRRPDFSTPLERRALEILAIAPTRHEDVYRTRITDGVLNTGNMQAYYFSTLASNEFPAGIALLDGPRGHGSAVMATHIQVGRNGGVYFCDPWRVAHIDPDGTIKTLAGWRHRSPAERPASDTPAALRASVELVGDWSAIPPERHGFHEAWGLAWDARTVQRGTGAPIPNPPNPDEPAHDTNPVAFVADSQRNRICRLEFDGHSHATPVKVTEFITGLLDPWDCVCVDGVLYVSERLSHRIAAYDATTGAFIRVVVQGQALSTTTTWRAMQRTSHEAAIKDEPTVAPEGLYHLDGWLYFGSWSQATIKRVNLASGAIETVVDIAFASTVISGGNFFKIAVSDGTFGPRGTVFMVSWAIVNGGRPMAWLPNGQPWSYAGLGSEGPGMVFDSDGYGSACGVGQGRLIYSTSSEGLWDIHQAPAGAPRYLWGDQQRCKAAYEAEGLHLTHGPGGWGYYGLPLPWGRSADIDLWLAMHGHTRGV